MTQRYPLVWPSGWPVQADILEVEAVLIEQAIKPGQDPGTAQYTLQCRDFGMLALRVMEKQDPALLAAGIFACSKALSLMVGSLAATSMFNGMGLDLKSLREVLGNDLDRAFVAADAYIQAIRSGSSPKEAQTAAGNAMRNK